METKRSEAGHVRLNRARTEAAATGKWQAEVTVLMEEGPKEHDNGASFFGSLNIHVLKLEFLWWNNLEIVVFEPATLHTDTFEHLDYAVDFFDASNAAKCGLSLVEECSTEEADGSVLACFYFDFTI